MANPKKTYLLAFMTLPGLIAGAPTEPSPKVIKLPFSVSHHEKSNNASSSANVTRRDTPRVRLRNDIALYIVETEFGTPGQKFDLQIDTGSSDTWVFGPGSCQAETEGCSGKEFDISKSSTAKTLAADGMDMTYVSGGAVHGDYVSDKMRMGDVTIDEMAFGVASSAKGMWNGIMGLGPGALQSATKYGGKGFPTILDHLLDKGKIKSRSFSIWLDSEEAKSGNILFGGYDEAKFKGQLTPLPMVERMDGQVWHLSVAFTSFSATGPDGQSKGLGSEMRPQPAIVDTGSTFTYLNGRLAAIAADAVGASWIDSAKLYVLECAKGRANTGALNYGFAGIHDGEGFNISIPVADLVQDAYDDNGDPATLDNGENACLFGVSALVDPENEGMTILGDVFMRHVYVVFNLDKKQISMAPGIPGSQGGKIREIVSGDSDGKDREKSSESNPGGNERGEESGETGGAAVLSPDVVTVLVVAGLLLVDLI